MNGTTGRSARWGAAATLPQPNRPAGAIAIVGCGCILPGAHDPDAFWAALESGRSMLRPLGDDDPRFATFLRSTEGAPLRGRPVGRITDHTFDWRRFKIPPLDAQSINPLQLMVLDAGDQALRDLKALPHRTTGMFIGATGLGWQPDSGLRIRLHELEAAVRAGGASPDPTLTRAMAKARAALDASLKPVSEDNVVGASASVALGRLSIQYDLQGLHYAVDSGFASSLAAVDMATRALRAGEIDLAVAGGVSELLTPLELLAFERVGGLSPSSLRAFDRDADGTALSEGCVVFALKRLDDAIADGEKIFAVLLGIGGATDDPGRSVLAPSRSGQNRALRAALSDAGVSADSVGYIECHATGTSLGDATELSSVDEVYGDSGAPAAVGSAKSVFGHLRGAAGAVGLLKAALSLERGRWPAQPAYATPPPGAPHEVGRLTVSTEAQRLTPRGGASDPRMGVSAVGFGGTTFHAVLQAPPPPGDRARRTMPAAPKPLDEPIALVSVGARLPGADNAEAFRRVLDQGLDLTRTIPPDRWNVDGFFDDDPERLETCYTKLGCFLDELPRVADARWRIPPSAMSSLDPCQLLALQAADEALDPIQEFVARWDKKRVGVMLAFLPYQGRKFLADIRVNSETYWQSLHRALLAEGVAPSDVDAQVDAARQRFLQTLPEVTEDSLPGWLGSLCAARISRAFSLGGPHFVVDSACASTHAAVHAAVTALRHGVCDAVLSGGVWADMMPEFFVAACRFNALSPTGSTPFDEGADGFIPGEGAGVFVLRRLADAEAAGEPIVAVLRSVAGSSDGKGSSVLAPTEDGEALAMRRALSAASLGVDDVDYVECHGTGTALGDVVEIKAVKQAYAGRTMPMQVGSVKSNIGHLNAAAGVPALMKAAWAVRDGVLPRSLKVTRENPKLDLDQGTPVRIVTAPVTWGATDGKPRRAGVSGFGVGGSNMHLIVEQYVPAAARSEETKGQTRSSAPVARRAEEAQMLKRGASGNTLTEALRHLEQGRVPDDDHAVRVALVGQSDDGERLLGLFAAAADQKRWPALAAQGVLVGSPQAPGAVAATFPGQGPHYPNMVADLARALPDVGQTLAEVDAIYRELAGRALTPAFLTGDEAAYQQPDEDIHCATLAVNVALYRALGARGFSPDVVLGQSAGELSALCCAGALSLRDALFLMRARTQAVLTVPAARAGVMISLPRGAADAMPALATLEGGIWLAADNGPGACLVSADAAGAASVQRWADAQGINAETLAVSHGYHSELIADAVPAYRAALDRVEFRSPRIPVLSTVTGGELTRFDLGRIRDVLAEQLVRPVRLADAVRAAALRGVNTFVECGPKRALTTFVADVLADRPVVAVATLHPKVGEALQFSRAWAALWTRGRAEAPFAAAAPARAPASAETELDAALGHVRAALRATTTRDEAARLLVRVQQELVQLTLSLDDERALARAAPLPVAAPLPLADPVPAPVPAPVQDTPPPTPAAPEDEVVTRVRAQLIAALVERTGYPVDMVELDLDLEADLGIDTVKQVAAFGAVREALGLEIEEGFRLRDFPTVRLVADHFASRLKGSSSAPQAPVGLSAPPPRSTSSPEAAPAPLAPPASASMPFDRVAQKVIDELVARTGYPPDMIDLDLDLEADLGIDTVKQVAAAGVVREALGLTVQEDFRLRDVPTVRLLAEHFCRRLLQEHGGAHDAAPLPEPLPVAAPPEPAAPRGRGVQVESLTLARFWALLTEERDPSAGGWLVEQARIQRPGFSGPAHLVFEHNGRGDVVTLAGQDGDLARARVVATPQPPSMRGPAFIPSATPMPPRLVESVAEVASNDPAAFELIGLHQVGAGRYRAHVRFSSPEESSLWEAVHFLFTVMCLDATGAQRVLDEVGAGTWRAGSVPDVLQFDAELTVDGAGGWKARLVAVDEHGPWMVLRDLRGAIRGAPARPVREGRSSAWAGLRSGVRAVEDP